jgi:hypothetical protein
MDFGCGTLLVSLPTESVQKIPAPGPLAIDWVIENP